jgi:drug/metabolite transporter (DMT)-like permease
MNYLFLFLNVLTWGLAPVLIKWLSRYFDIHTQNFYRFLAAGISLSFTAWINYPGPWSRALKKLGSFVWPAIFVVATQVLWVSGIYLSKASLAMLMGKLDVFFIILFSYFIFHDERKVVKSNRFKIGVIMALIGVIGVTVGQGKVSVGMGWGMVMIFLSRVTWALYAVTVKITTSKFPSIISSALVMSIGSVFLFPIGLGWGHLGQLGQTSFWVLVLLFASGIVCIGVGQGLFHRNIQKMGTVITSSFILSTPLVTLVLAYLILGEKLTFFQIVSGLLILAGCYIILPSNPRTSYNF